MALSIQRTAMILVITRMIVVLFLFGAATGGTSDNLIDVSSFNDKVEEKQFNIRDFLLSDGVNIGGTYTDTKIGDEQYGFKMSVWDVLVSGGLGWFPLKWATNSFERMIIFILSTFSSFLTMLAGFEAFQILRGKTT